MKSMRVRQEKTDGFRQGENAPSAGGEEKLSDDLWVHGKIKTDGIKIARRDFGGIFRTILAREAGTASCFFGIDLTSA
jgi:hypothetical protein